MTNEECTRIYNQANGITNKHPPISTERIFIAMRACRKLQMKTILITAAVTIVLTASLIAASTYVWLKTLPKVYTCQKLETV